MNKRNALRFFAAAAVMVSAGLAGCSGKSEFHAVDISGATYAHDFSLADTDGRTRTLADFKGKVVVLFFGYAQCPDVCPTTMLQMKEVKEQLGADGNRMQAIFITVDPERDTPAVLKEYMQAFDPSFIALIPQLEQLPELTKNFKVFFQKVAGATPTSYTVDHTAASFVYDPQGRLRLYVRYGTPTASVVADVKALLAGS